MPQTAQHKYPEKMAATQIIHYQIPKESRQESLSKHIKWRKNKQTNHPPPVS